MELVPAAWPAIMDQKTFHEVQEILKKNRTKLKPTESKGYAYPLTEQMICGECGSAMGGGCAHGARGMHHYYKHPRQLKADGVGHKKRCRLERVRAMNGRITEQKEVRARHGVRRTLKKPPPPRKGVVRRSAGPSHCGVGARERHRAISRI